MLRPGLLQDQQRISVVLMTWAKRIRRKSCGARGWTDGMAAAAHRWTAAARQSSRWAAQGASWPEMPWTAAPRLPPQIPCPGVECPTRPACQNAPLRPQHMVLSLCTAWRQKCTAAMQEQDLRRGQISRSIRRCHRDDQWAGCSA